MRILAIGLALLLAGCGTTRTVIQEVKIPIPCNPEMPQRPASAVDALPLDAEIDEQMRALRADRLRSNAYTGQLESALQSCRSDTM